jgi:hypothetical protein
VDDLVGVRENEASMSGKLSSASVSAGDGKTVYVLVHDKDVFDAIDLPVSEGNCLSKSLEQPGGVCVIFQFWK